MKLPYLLYSSYRTCPLQYKFKFVERPDVFISIDKRNAFIGILLAKLVERFYRERWWEEKDIVARMQKVIPLISQQITDIDRIKWNPGEHFEWLKIAHETVPKILKMIRAEKLLGNPGVHPSDENLVEFEVEIPFEGDDLQARIDLLIKRADVITLLDGKGGKTVGKYVDPDQLYFYCLGVKQVFGRLPHRMGFWWFRHDRIVWFPVTNDLVDELLVKVRNVLAGIKGGRFDPTPNQACRLCDYRIVCDPGQRFIAARGKVALVDIPNNYGEVSFADF